MPEVVLIPDIDHCIETVAKQRHAVVVRRLLASEGNNQKLLEIAELLKNFLETADFKKLRAESERHMANGKRVELVVHSKGGVPAYHFKISSEPKGNSRADS